MNPETDDSTTDEEQPTKFLTDRIPAEYNGEEITIWNHLKVYQTHIVHASEIEHHHKILIGDGSTGETPEYITPKIAEQLESLNVYPAPTVLDPRDDEVTLL